MARDLCIAPWVEPTLGCHSDDVLGQPQRAVQGKTRRHAELVDTRSLQAKDVCHDEGGYELEPCRLDDETTTGTKIVQFTKIMGFGFVGQSSRQEEFMV